MKTKLYRFNLIVSVIFIALANNASAEDSANRTGAIDKYAIKNNQVTPLFKTLFLSQKARKKIDEQREAYLNPKLKVKPKAFAKVSPKVQGKPKKKRIYIPPKVAISAVIVKPDGTTLIRVNNQYNKSPSKYINMDMTHANTDGVPITVNGKTQIVPVGTTLLTRKNKLVDSHKLKANMRKNLMPKTEQKAVKQTLQQVQILNARPLTAQPQK